MHDVKLDEKAATFVTIKNIDSLELIMLVYVLQASVKEVIFHFI